MLFYFVLLASIISITSQENCEDIVCSNVIDYVCGAIEFGEGNVVIMKYQNICIMRKTSCKLKPIADLYQTNDNLCNIKKKIYNLSGRRVADFSIVGAHQACNHTCPTYCVDTYKPACAQIWKVKMKSSTYRPMINHCHIDLFSCSTGLNVTIHPLAICYTNPSGLLFMAQVAAMKSLKLLDDTSTADTHNKYTYSANKRRSNQEPREILLAALRQKLAKSSLKKRLGNILKLQYSQAST